MISPDFQLMDKGDRRKAQGLSGGQAQYVFCQIPIFRRLFPDSNKQADLSRKGNLLESRHLYSG